jgi:hypothetical protein
MTFPCSRFLLGALFLLLATACVPEDEAVTLPPVSDSLVVTELEMGAEYPNRVYFDLGSQEATVVPNKTYDLQLESSPAGDMLYVNTGKQIRVLAVTQIVESVDSSEGGTGVVYGPIDPALVVQHIVAPIPEYTFVPDSPSLRADSVVFRDWQTGNFLYVLQRGVRTPGFDWDKLMYKLKVISADVDSWTIEWGPLNATLLTRTVIPKDKSRSFTYFSFDNGGQVVQVEPPKKDWDLVFQQYSHIFTTEPVNSPFRNYAVTGAIANLSQGVQALRMHTQDLPWEEASLADAQGRMLSDKADEIGFDWKSYDIQDSFFTIIPDVYYYIRDTDGTYYKLRFLDFYGSDGVKGSPLFEYKQLK